MLQNLQKDITSLSDPQKVAQATRFFKTKEGQYGYGDIFLGLTVPQQRILSRTYKDLPFEDVKKLLTSKYHEHRLIALFIMVDQYKKANEKKRKEIYEYYLANTAYINNWDLVDSSADKIVGEYLYSSSDPELAEGESRSNSSRQDGYQTVTRQARTIKVLRKLATSTLLWDRRIAMIACYQFIKHREYTDAFVIAELLLSDKHDLIHKAVGWMLREIGEKCGVEIEEVFLKKHYKTMPRTMLRYAIEKFPEEKRKKYLAGTL